MSEVLVRFERAQELVLERLAELGIFKTRSEAIRAGILQLGKEYGVFKNSAELADALTVRRMSKVSKGLKNGGLKVFSEAVVRKKHGL